MPNLEDLLSCQFADGGRGPDRWDCYGLCIEVFKRYGKDIPKDYFAPALNSLAVYRQFKKVVGDWELLTEPQTPCLVAFSVLSKRRMVNHVGVYIGGGKFIHSCQGLNVTVSALSNINWRNSVIGYYKYKEAGK